MPKTLTADFMTSTFVMSAFAVFGLRSVFSLPVSLNANWVLRATQLRPSEDYVSATRLTLLVLGVVPVCIVATLLSLPLRPLHQVAGHIVILALIGWIFVELSLIGFYKVPFTCSYLPGKVHVQVVFLCFLLLLVIFAMVTAEYEQPALGSPVRTVLTLVVLSATGLSLWVHNRRRARSAVLYFEEAPPEIITSLGLVWLAASSPNQGAPDAVGKQPS